MSRRLETLFKYSHIKIQDGSSLWQTAHLKSISVHRQVRKKEKKKKLNVFFPPLNIGIQTRIYEIRFLVSSWFFFFFRYEIIRRNCPNANDIPSYSLTLLCTSKTEISTVIVSYFCINCSVTRHGRNDRESQSSGFQVQISLRDVRIVVDIHRAKTTRQAMYV